MLPLLTDDPFGFQAETSTIKFERGLKIFDTQGNYAEARSMGWEHKLWAKPACTL